MDIFQILLIASGCTVAIEADVYRQESLGSSYLSIVTCCGKAFLGKLTPF
jgi:hypothetical protein